MHTPKSTIPRKNRPRLRVGPIGNARARMPAVAYRQRNRFRVPKLPQSFSAPERWHGPQLGGHKPRFVVEPASCGYRHPLTPEEIRARLALLPPQFLSNLEVVQLSRMTRKRHAFPCYGMQWGWSIYLYPIEEDLIEVYGQQPSPPRLIEARMYGGCWVFEQGLWKLK